MTRHNHPRDESRSFVSEPHAGRSDEAFTRDESCRSFPFPDIALAAEFPVFRDAAIQRNYVDDGYVSLPVLDHDQVLWLREQYGAIRPDDDADLMIDYMREDRTMMRAVWELAESLIAPVVDEFFVDHRVCFISVVTKHPSANSGMFLHEDRSFVDERVCRSGTLWIPLVDVGPGLSNGALNLVPGSHLLGTTFSGSLTPQPYRPYESHLEKVAVTPTVDAGAGLFYDARTLHSSAPNTSTSPREAVVCAIVPRGVDLIHVVASGRRRRHMFRVDQSFYLDHHPREVTQKMPASAELIETWDEPLSSIAGQVAALVNLDEPPDPLVVLGSQVIAPSAVVTQRVEVAEFQDLKVTVASGAVSDELASRHRFVSDGGSVTIRRVMDSECLLPSIDLIDAELVVMEPGTSLSVDLKPSRFLDPVLVIVDAPQLGAFAKVGDDFVQLDPGIVVPSLDQGSIVLRTVGPGLVVAMVGMIPMGSRRMRRLGHSILSRVRNRTRSAPAPVSVGDLINLSTVTMNRICHVENTPR